MTDEEIQLLEDIGDVPFEETRRARELVQIMFDDRLSSEERRCAQNTYRIARFQEKYPKAPERIRRLLND
jgi:hypothetical protein